MKALTILARRQDKSGKQGRTDLVSDTIIDNDLIPESEIDNYMLMRFLKMYSILLCETSITDYSVYTNTGKVIIRTKM